MCVQCTVQSETFWCVYSAQCTERLLLVCVQCTVRLLLVCVQCTVHSETVVYVQCTVQSETVIGVCTVSSAQ